jgi:hypothetical protein
MMMMIDDDDDDDDDDRLCHCYFYTHILKLMYTITPFLYSHLYYNTFPFLSFCSVLYVQLPIPPTVQTRRRRRYTLGTPPV